MERSGVEYQFTWNLVDLGGDAEVAGQPSQALSTVH
jgi:hypothetical protein